MPHTSDKYRCCKNPGLSVSQRAPAPKRKNISFLHTSTHTRTLQLTPSSTVLLAKLAVPQLIKKFPAFYGNRRFITLFTIAQTFPYHEPDKSSPRPSSDSFNINFNIILQSALGSPSGLFTPAFHIKTLHAPLSPPRVTFLDNTILHHLITLTVFGEHYRSYSSSVCNFLQSPVTSYVLGPISSSAPCYQTPSACVPPSMWATKYHTHIKQQINLQYTHTHTHTHIINPYRTNVENSVSS